MFSRYRKFIAIGVGATLLAALTAGPLSAASSNKTYTVSASTLPYTSTSPVTGPVSITYTNMTPSASVNSVTLTAPSGWSISTTNPVTATESGGTAGNYNTSTTYDSKTGLWTIAVTNLSPVGYLQTVTVSFTATATWNGTLSCTNNAGTWTTTAWTGSNLGGNQFTLSGSPATTSIGSDLASGATISITGVSLTNNSGSCVPVTISRNGNSVTILKPTSSTDNFTLDILWDPEPAAMPMTHVDTVTNASGGTSTIQWCNGTTSSLGMPTSQVSCLVSESAQVYGPDSNGNQQTQVHDVVYLLGDYSIVRG